MIINLVEEIQVVCRWSSLATRLEYKQRYVCVDKYIVATRDLKRAWATNLPSNWSKELPNK